MPEPLTLVVPNFNGAHFLPHTLRSLAENRPHVRWRLQDGGSRDNSVALAQQWASPADVIVSAPDAGQTDALNRGLAQAGGEIIGFLNSDDELAPDAAASVLEYFRAHPEVDLVYGEVEWIDAVGRVIGHHAGRIETLADVLNIYEVWWRDRQWVQPEVFFRRSLWERVGPFASSYRLAFDYDYWVRCFKAGVRLGRLPRVLARFRLHPGQKSRAAGEAAAEIRAIAERHLEDATVPRSLAQRLHAQIDYERYHLGEGQYGQAKPSFLRYVVTHPRALGIPVIRQRIRNSCANPFRAATPRNTA